MLEKFRLQRKVLKRSGLRGIGNSAFTLVEVLISLVLLGIGLSVSTKAFVAGKYFMKESENKARAMEIASLQMNNYLTKSYGDLVAGSTAPVTDAKGFTWTVNVQDLTKAPVAPKINTIPYKSIEVVCGYNETNINGAVATKNVRLANIVVYPYMHLYSTASTPSTAQARCYGSPCTTNASTAAGDALSTVVSLDFQTLVQSDLLIFYNISIDIQDSTSITPVDLIFSKCFIAPIDDIGGSPTGAFAPYEIQTGTPIMTQPTISNTVSVPILATGKYRLKIVWFKDHSAGTIMGKKANVVIFQVEK